MTKPTGSVLNCKTCGNEFYASGWQLRDTPARQPKYCSVKCRQFASRSRKMPWAKPEEKTFHGAGYVLVWAPDHPKSTRTYKRIFEHILVAEKMLGRFLEKGEQVHHKDHNRQNNDPSNLIVLTTEEHSRLHALTNPITQSKRVEIQCQECGKTFKVKRYQTNPDAPQSLRKYCSLVCRHKSWGRQMAAIRKKEN